MKEWIQKHTTHPPAAIGKIQSHMKEPMKALKDKRITKVSILPAQLRAWRAAHNLSQSKAAERLGITQRTLENWEQGCRKPGKFAREAVMAILQKGK
jgi:DNA-binding transcriptional regulator YiaG